MPQHVACPRCRSRLVIRDDAPAHLACPRCLGPIRNPHAPATGPAPTTAAAARPVLNYGSPATDREVHKDSRGTAYALVALGVTLAAGALLSFAAGARGTGALLLLALLAAIGTTADYYRQQRQGLDPSAASRVGFTLVRGCAAALLLFFGLVVLLVGLCTAFVAGSAAFHR
jgi:hypothetical protein